MHLGNGALTPECVAATCSAAALGLGAAAWHIRRGPVSGRKLAAVAVVGATVFAAQASNVPVLPFASGHLVGGVLAAWLLGPALGAWTIFAVLAIQAGVLGDGGLAALGANTLNMALIPAAAVVLVRRQVAADRPNLRRDISIGLAVVCIASLVVAAGLIVGEVALGRSGAELAGLGDFAWRMLSYHLWIGVGEAILTLAVVYAIGVQRLPGSDRLPKRRVYATVAAAALVLAIALPFASGLPDGYEAAAERSQMAWLLGADEG
ncbi:MAG: energy-coupling factor ABC transporter permease [Pirellulales bacterium]